MLALADVPALADAMAGVPAVVLVAALMPAAPELVVAAAAGGAPEAEAAVMVPVAGLDIEAALALDVFMALGVAVELVVLAAVLALGDVAPLPAAALCSPIISALQPAASAVVEIASAPRPLSASRRGTRADVTLSASSCDVGIDLSDIPDSSLVIGNGKWFVGLLIWRLRRP
jgi:hypothetical protein